MLKIRILGIAFAAFALSVVVPAASAETIPSPLQQVQEGVPFDEIQCRDGKVPMQSPGGTPACVNESSSAKLVERGWKAVAGLQTNQEATHGGHACKGQQETANVGKFDPGLFDRIGEMLDANVTGSYSVLLIVSDGDMQAVEQVLVDCHGATNVAAARSLSFVTASVPLGEIQALSAYDEVRQIGAGELFEIPVASDDVEGTTWVQIDPVQCGGNPWGYARSSPDVIKGYYADLGVDVFDLKTAHTHQLVCGGCSCPAGITLSLRVSHDDVRTMLSLGFMPPDKQPDAPRKPRLSSADIENTGDRPFVTTWRTISPNESITIPVGNATGAYAVDWGDGSVSANVTGDQSHAYSDAGEYTVRISGDFTRILLAEDHDNSYKIVSIEQWGDTQWESMASAFMGVAFTSHAADTPDLSKVTDMSGMFQDSDFNGGISGWDVSKVTDMSGMFQDSGFNDDISSWDVSGVEDMHRMFTYSAFNGDLSGWDVSGVEDMGYMFSGTPFNGDISDWDVSGVEDMGYMFSGTPFNGDISDWDVSGVEDMSSMFRYASFKGDISDWDVSGVSDMYDMFSYSDFNGDISGWDVSNVENMSEMFFASSFKGDLSGWDVSGVTDMHEMFASSVFNGDLSDWDVSGVEDMSGMFRNALFLGGIAGWDVSSVKDMSEMFLDTPFFHSHLSGWDVSNVENMYRMFRESSFNGDVSGWDVSSVKNMGEMFLLSPFNGDVSGWDVSGVKNMHRMFHIASSFNGDLSGWDVSNVENMSQMFSRASSFVQNLGNWYVVLDSTSIDIGSGATKIGNIAAQNPILDSQNPTYGIGTGADSDLFEIYGDILMIKPSVDYGKAGYAVNVTSTGDFGVNNFRVISVTVTGADYDETTSDAAPTNGGTSDTNTVLSSSNCNPECIATLKSWLDTSSPLTIEFDRFVDDNIDGEEGLYVQYSTDGTTWITLASYTEDNNQDTDEWEVTSLTLDIEQNSASLRFVAKSNAPDEFIEIDNLSIYPKGADPVAP